MKVQYNRETAVIPWPPTRGSVGYDLSASCNCAIPPKGKRVVQIGLGVSLSLRVYAKIAPHSGLAVKTFIDVGTRVIESESQGEIGVVVFNHSAMDFLVKISQLILENIKTPVIQKVIVLSATERGSGGFVSTGLQSNDPLASVKQK